MSTTRRSCSARRNARNAAAVAAGRVRLVCASVEDLLPNARDEAGPMDVPAAPFDVPFDAVLAVNNVGFWSEPEVHLAGVRRLLRPDGQIALVAQPRCPGATAATSRSAAGELADLLTRAGFSRLQTTLLDLDPPVACVQAANPDDVSVSPPASVR